MWQLYGHGCQNMSDVQDIERILRVNDSTLTAFYERKTNTEPIQTAKNGMPTKPIGQLLWAKWNTM